MFTVAIMVKHKFWFLFYLKFSRANYKGRGSQIATITNNVNTTVLPEILRCKNVLKMPKLNLLATF